MSFINPNYYGFSASAVILLSDFESDCERDGGSELECYTASGDYTLAIFDFSTVNPYQNIVVSPKDIAWHTCVCACMQVYYFMLQCQILIQHFEQIAKFCFTC